MRFGYALLVGGLIALIIIMGAGLLSADEYGARVAVIPVTGVITITGGGDFLSGTGASSSDIVRWIEDADASSATKIILLEINSPGGHAVASDEIARAVERAEKPVVAWIREMGASGAYWVASEADYVIANRMSLTGSVGVIASYLEFGEFLNEHNVTYRKITAGKHKDIGTPFSELTAEQERLLLKKLERTHEFFLDDVQQNRNLTDEQRATIETGIYFLGVEAYELGLVDALGGKHEVEEYLKEQLGDEPTYRRYEREKTFVEQLAGVRAGFLEPGLRIQT